MSLKPEIQAVLDKFDPVIQTILTANQDQRPLMAIRNIEHLITTIDANKSVITPEVFTQVMKELGKDSLIELTDIYKVRNRFTALINSTDTSTTKSAAEPAVPAPVAAAAPEVQPVKAQEAQEVAPAFGDAFGTPTPELAATAPKKLTATKNPVMVVEDKQAEVVEAEVVVTPLVETAPAAEETAETVIESILSDLPPFPTAETPTIINVTAETVTPEVSETSSEASEEHTPARRGRKPGTAAKSSNVDNLVLQLLNKLDEKDSKIAELEKRLEELEQEAANSVKITPALAKRLEKFGIQI